MNEKKLKIKAGIVFVLAMVFLFGQIGILAVADMYLSTFSLTLTWASALLCGLFVYWSLGYLTKAVQLLKEIVK